jgi:nicotinamidase-related amidase
MSSVRPPLSQLSTIDSSSQRSRRNATVRALVIVNCQNDFFEGGATPVPHARRVIEHINTHLRPRKFDLVILTKQMRSSNDTTFCSNNPGTKIHEVEHLSKFGAQKMVPDHCVRGTHGCRLRPELIVDPCDIIVETCTNPAGSKDSHETRNRNQHHHQKKKNLQEIYRRSEINLGSILTNERVTDVYLCGVPTEFIALETVRTIRSALQNVKIYHISDASRPIQPSSTSARTAHDQMKRQRVIDIQSTGAEIDRIPLRKGKVRIYVERFVECIVSFFSLSQF